MLGYSVPRRREDVLMAPSDDSIWPALRSAIDHAQSQDPEQENGQPAALLYADRVESWMPKLIEPCGDFERLAGRCQHLERWAIPRADYPMDRPGYLRWRRDLGARQGERAAEMAADAGLDAERCERLQKVISKRAKGDALAQALEDAACLVFLEHHALAFAGGHSEEKVIAILQKTWGKMSERGHELALSLDLHPAVGALVTKALTSES